MKYYFLLNFVVSILSCNVTTIQVYDDDDWSCLYHDTSNSCDNETFIDDIINQSKHSNKYSLLKEEELQD